MNAIVTALKDINEDWEFYPSTQPMLDCIKQDMMLHYHTYENAHMVLSCVNVLDCGAGDGRVLESLANGGQKYAIEKSKFLIDQMPENIFIVGTDFFQSTLIDKKVDVVFCNPPYSEFVPWTCKVILEANARHIYLIIPQRWKNNDLIQKALKTREAKFKVIKSDNFLNAERSARAEIDIISIDLSGGYHRSKECATDPFDIWFDQCFQLESEKESAGQEPEPETIGQKINKQMTDGQGLVPALVQLYNLEMEHLQAMFLSICKLDGGILKELGVDTKTLKGSLKQRITGLKIKFWKELFDNYDRITKRLTHTKKKALLAKLTENTSIDFTESNIYAVTVWVIKNANQYYDAQLIDLVERMITSANIILYKSNKRVFKDQDWRYCRSDERNLTHFGLELRIVLHNTGGVKSHDAWGYDYTNNLANRAHEFIDDIITVANNLGFVIPSWVNSKQVAGDWISNQSVNFYEDPIKKKMLMTVKAFMNGNLHIKFNQEFIKTLNVEFGRLKGWLTDHIQASEELNIPVEQAKKFFKANRQLTYRPELLQIGFNESDERISA